MDRSIKNEISKIHLEYSKGLTLVELLVVISIFMIITDRLLVKIVKPRLLSILELLVIIAFVSTIYILHKIG